MSPVEPESSDLRDLQPGTRVRITQHISARHYEMTTPVEGTIVSLGERPTGSWFAHGPADRLWLERVVIRKADGEVSTLNVDESSRIEILGSPAGADSLDSDV